MELLDKDQLRASPVRNIILNGLMFNVSWLLIVSQQSAMWAILVVLVHLGLHFSVMGRGWPELRLVLLVSLLGVVLDQILFALGVFLVSGLAAAAPVWLSCLWPVLATTLMHAFSPLRQRPALAMVLGAAGGTGSYLAGIAMTDVGFASPVWGPVIMAILWGILFPTLLAVAAKETAAYEKRYYAWT